jgi:hypothetical protein
MLTPAQIQSEIDSIVKKIKGFEYHKNKPDNKYHYPEFYEGYNELCDQFDSICIHAEKGKFPDKLFLKRSPNQQPDEFEYVKQNYKQTTLPVFIDYVNQLKRSFNDGNWAIHYSDEDFQKYVEKEFPVYGSVEEFEKEVLPVIKSKDPMGMLAMRPKEIPIMRDSEGNPVLTPEGVFRFDDSIPVEPMINYFTVKQLVKFKENKFYIYLSRQKTIVKHGNQDCEDGMIFEVYDEQNIWFVKQIGKKTEFQFEIILYYNHALGYVPARRLKGIPVVDEYKVYYQSPFLYCVDSLDLVLLNSSNLQMSINHCVYPVRIMIGNECDFKEGEHRCSNGIISYYDKEVHIEKTCLACNGSGLKTRISPLGTILLKPSGRDNPNGEISPDAAFKYVSPELSTLEFLMKKIADDEARARGIAHIYNTNTNAQGSDSETATGKYIDQKTLYSFIKPISDEMFQTWEWIYKVTGEMRYGQSFKAPHFVYPITFEFLTEQDYIAQIKQSMDAGMPPSVIYPLIYRFLSTLFYTEPETNAAFVLISEADRLLTQMDVQISTGILNNTVQKWEKILHDSAFYFVKELKMEDEKFFDKTIEEQKKMLVEKAQAKANELNPVAIGSAVESLGEGAL